MCQKNYVNVVKKNKKKTGLCLAYVRGFIDAPWKLLNTRETRHASLVLSSLTRASIYVEGWKLTIKQWLKRIENKTKTRNFNTDSITHYVTSNCFRYRVTNKK